VGFNKEEKKRKALPLAINHLRTNWGEEGILMNLSTQPPICEHCLRGKEEKKIRKKKRGGKKDLNICLPIHDLSIKMKEEVEGRGGGKGRGKKKKKEWKTRLEWETRPQGLIVAPMRW